MLPYLWKYPSCFSIVNTLTTYFIRSCALFTPLSYHGWPGWLSMTWSFWIGWWKVLEIMDLNDELEYQCWTWMLNLNLSWSWTSNWIEPPLNHKKYHNLWFDILLVTLLTFRTSPETIRSTTMCDFISCYILLVLESLWNHKKYHNLWFHEWETDETRTSPENLPWKYKKYHNLWFHEWEADENWL